MICDAIVLVPVDVQFDFIHRRGAADTVIATWSEHFEPLPDGVYEAQPYELDVQGAAIDFEPGDQFVWRFIGTSQEQSMAFIPNGDGATANGRIPRVTLPR